MTTVQKSTPSLVFCILMDVIGYASFAVPGLAEISDVVWAPISAFIFYKTFGGLKGAFGGIFNFAEEILPFTDFIPSFTIMWVWQYFTRSQQAPATNTIELKPAAKKIKGWKGFLLRG